MNAMQQFSIRKKYTTNCREPFYDIAIPYLPGEKSSVVVDIGAGHGGFCFHLELAKKYDNLFLLDGNIETVCLLQKEKFHATQYKAPDRLPFDDYVVDFIHCSHMVEHLYPDDLHVFLDEINRVLKRGGVLFLSTPLMHSGFYNDLSHIKPYFPSVFERYLCKTSTEQKTQKTVSDLYHVEELVYRYGIDRSIEWGAENGVLNFVIVGTFKLLRMCGINKYRKTGFSMMLRKS
ncbi:MAG: class I SAM-dependent methyltransferase [Kiritimatiellales bacterium]|nr:class I SAM-dependent methyltransferase [Kiritimatiellales bacterium]